MEELYETLVVLQSSSESGVIPDLIVQIVATVSGVIISVGVPLILAKLNKFGKLYTTVFGVEDVESMSGLVGVVEAHDEEIGELQNKQESIKDRVRDLEESVRQRRENDG